MSINFSSTILSQPWTKNVDPLVDNYLLVNDDIWMLFAFLGVNVLLSAILKGDQPSEQAKIRPYAFVYNSFVCGMCISGFLICCVVSKMGYYFMLNPCDHYGTYSDSGFRGRIMSYIVYLAFLMKLVQLTEAIWTRKMAATGLFFVELLLCLAGMKYDATEYIWVGGLVNLPFMLFDSFFNAYEAAGYDVRTEWKDYQVTNARKKCMWLFITLQCGFLLVHGSYTGFTAGCNYPKHWAFCEFAFSLVAVLVYPRVYIQEYQKSKTA
ncbi:hypothetical protein HDE_08433 [Halotydeus destructor]|nr:hypothetical protein HDE_08433 [Halotydeus destructor]